jgi:hypothetical protein
LTEIVDDLLIGAADETNKEVSQLPRVGHRLCRKSVTDGNGHKFFGVAWCREIY